MSQTWSHGLFGCFSDIGLCLVTFLVPCYTNGRNAEATGESCIMHAIYFLIPLVGFYCHATTRGKIREKKNIDGTFFNDLLCSICCAYCALIQEGQELSPSSFSMARE
ncbi:PREDICTED: protein PLANT CADMIUM RESISTANCE 3-like isoform X1 [Amphimedon queenslandica]|uniref:Uncharacterized protein n=1 Tax=Amphimedon queenslandica TaxID=400682 RepID=A0A1X7VVT7_AMPQE|nr:PREDICTED: protein PLANT CADMIUM RESISTANCE 3-like isoform X1 [Amphimedon queenslandica]|eukprot:XP_003382500.1 PREDICTED: protein PLANT CADMIUM RESISTANCE 3-like isoform X1 [Amphimedon queenslandica]